MSEVDIVARSAQQAVQKAAAQLGVDPATLGVVAEYEPDELDLKSLSEEEAANPALAIEGEPVLYRVSAEVMAPVKRAEEVARNVLKAFEDAVTIEAVPYGRAVLVRVTPKDASVLIGKQGATLDALQHVVARCCQSKDESFPEVILDVEGYREKRFERLTREAHRQAQRAVKFKQNIALESMNSTERKYVHNLLKDFPGISTRSEGREPDRYIVIMVEGATNAAHRSARPFYNDEATEGEGSGEATAEGGAPAPMQGRRGKKRSRRGGFNDFKFNAPPQNRPQQQGGGGGKKHHGGGQQRHQQRAPFDPDSIGNRAVPQRYSPPPQRHDDEDDNIGNRLIDPPFPSSIPQRGGRGGGFRGKGGYQGGGAGYRGKGGGYQGGGNRRGQYGSQSIDYAGLPKITPEEEEAAYRDQGIENNASRLPAYRPQQNAAPEREDGKMVDELE